MAKKRVYKHEERTSEKIKIFCFLFLPLDTLFVSTTLPSSLPSKNTHPTENLSIVFHVRRALNLRRFQKDIDPGRHNSNTSDASNIFFAQSKRTIIWVPSLNGLYESSQEFFVFYFKGH